MRVPRPAATTSAATVATPRSEEKELRPDPIGDRHGCQDRCGIVGISKKKSLQAPLYLRFLNGFSDIREGTKEARGPDPRKRISGPRQIGNHSMWPWNRSKTQDIDAGAVYRAPGNGLLVETATVLGRFDDQSGIPHVRYALRVATQTGASDGEEQRVLALGAFARRYSQYCGKKTEVEAAA
jgi:hypothetical protein